MIGLLFYLFVLFVLYTAGWHSAFWVFTIVPIFILLPTVCSVPKKKQFSGTSGRPRVRIDHPHYTTDDEYECSICGTRFEKPLTACPYCGVRFNCRQTDEDEYDEELDDELEMDEWDEEEGW